VSFDGFRNLHILEVYKLEGGYFLYHQCTAYLLIAKCCFIILKSMSTSRETSRKAV